MVRPTRRSMERMSGEFSLQAALQQGPVLAAFFKVSCPTCQYTFPFLERIHKAYGDRKITIVGISQNDQRDTSRFSEGVRSYLPYPARRSERLRGVECLRPDQCPDSVLDRTRRQDRNHQRWMGETGSGRHQSQARRRAADCAFPNLSTRRRAFTISAPVEAPGTDPAVAGQERAGADPDALA